MIMLKSVSANLVDMRSLAASGEMGKNLMRHLVDINDLLLLDVIKILEPFDAATKLLSADHNPTMHRVAATRHKIKTELLVLASDTTVIRNFKRHLIVQVDKYFVVTDFHRTAMLLDPRQKLNTTILSADERDSAITALRKMVDEVIINELVNAACNFTSANEDSATAMPLKKNLR